MESINKEEILNKINSGEFANVPQKKNHKSTKEPVSPSEKEAMKEIIQESNKEINGKAKEAKETKAAQAAKAPSQHLIANFPVKGFINRYGNIGLSIGIINALKLPLNQSDGTAKLASDNPIIFTSYDSNAKVLSIKIGE